MLINILLAILLAIWIFVSPLLELAASPLLFRPIYSPSFLYKHTSMSKRWCIFCFILIRILSPAITLFGICIQIMIYICDFADWIVGRMKK